MRLLLDVHVSSRNLGRPLRKRGHDVHALDSDDGRKELGDGEVLAFAAGVERIVITHTVKDFALELRRRNEAGEHHAGCILVALPHTAYGEILRRLEQLFGSLPDPQDWRDRAVWIGRSQ